ncbi:MAG: dynamin family protein [Thermoanaerobaculia bacterium]
MRGVLSPEQERLLAEERRQLGELATSLARWDASREDQATLERSVRQLEELFLLVVVGEFNSGKSTFINALLGDRLLDEGVTPTTSAVHRLRWGENEERAPGEDDIEEIAAPADLLRQVQIVDTPGTNALERSHETLTREFVPRSDLVLFVTSADRPFTESERAFIESVREWGKKLVFVINKIDILREEAEVAEVEAFVVESCRRLLGISPVLFAISARRALEAKLVLDGRDQLEASRFPALERYLAGTLDEVERVRLKLLNPLGVGARLADSYLEAARERVELLREDLATLERIEGQLEVFKEDLGREFRFRLTDVDNLLLACEQRGDEFFDETFRLARAVDLLNKPRVEAEFDRRVIADLPRDIERKVDEIIDWLVAAELRQWRAATEHLEGRRALHAERLVGEIGSFDTDRRQLLETVGRAAQRTIERFDRKREATRLAESVQVAVAGTALVEVGAIGLGAVVSALATTTLADITGLLAAGTLAALGFFILPGRRRRAKRQLAAKISDLRSRLLASLTAEFDRELDRGLARIREALSPYTRFVEAERRRLGEMESELEESSTALAALRRKIEEL